MFMGAINHILKAPPPPPPPPTTTTTTTTKKTTTKMSEDTIGDKCTHLL